MMDKHKQGTPEVWEEIFTGVEVNYSEELNNQNRVFEKAKTDFLTELFPKGKKKFLEVGCGTAYVALFFAKRGYETTAIDINKSVLDIARRNFEKEGQKGEFKVASVEKLPYPDNTFDVVTSFGLMEHFDHPEIGIAEMVRVLKRGGLFFADIVPNRFSVQFFGNIFNFIVTFLYWTLKLKPILGWKKAIRNFIPVYFENDYSWQAYKKIIEGAGVKNVEVRGNRPWPRLTLPPSVDKIYAALIRPTLPAWERFDRSRGGFSKVWGAGLWFWGVKS